MTAILNDDGWLASIEAWAKAHQGVFWWLGALSIATLVVSAFVVPVLLARIPRDYFVPERRHPHRQEERPSPVRSIELFLKNLLGGVLVLAGIAMLVLPGQGILTVLIGLGVMNFPGKYRIERWLIGRPAVLRAVNWIRGKAGQPPLVMTEAELQPDPQAPPSA